MRDAKKLRLSDAALLEAANRGSFDADLGGGVVKQRIAREGQGKSGGFRSIIALKPGKSAFFVFVFAKNARDNITRAELAAFKQLALELFKLNESALKKAVAAGSLVELREEDDEKAREETDEEKVSQPNHGRDS